MRPSCLDASYDLISFRPGSEPAWDRFRALFLPQAVLALRVLPEDDAITVMDLDHYVVKQMRDAMKEEGYSETILKRSEIVYRDVAEVRALFAMKFGDAAPHTTMDIIQLVRRGGRWWIASMVSDILRPGEPAPEGFNRRRVTIEDWSITIWITSVRNSCRTAIARDTGRLPVPETSQNARDTMIHIARRADIVVRTERSLSRHVHLRLGDGLREWRPGAPASMRRLRDLFGPQPTPCF